MPPATTAVPKQIAAAASPAPAQLPRPKPPGRGAAGSAPSTIPGAGAPGNPVLQGVPAYKSGFFTNPAKNPPGTFQRFAGAVGNLVGVTNTETRIYQEIFAAEGGVDVAPNGASSGITRTTLDDTIRRQRFGAVPRGTRPDQLTIDQRASFYRAYFDDVLGAAAAALSTGRSSQSQSPEGHDLLNEISNPLAAAAIADALFHHGRSAGTRVIQQALKDVNPADPMGIDGKMGPKTFEALQDTVSDPAKMVRLLDALASGRAQLLQREAALRRQSVSAGDLDRVEHFRFEGVR